MKKVRLHTFEPRKVPVQKRPRDVRGNFGTHYSGCTGGGIGSSDDDASSGAGGISFGTLYQYYPNKQALLYAVLKVRSIR
jgi:hypothetical protein